MLPELDFCQNYFLRIQMPVVLTFLDTGYRYSTFPSFHLEKVTSPSV